MHPHLGAFYECLCWLITLRAAPSVDAFRSISKASLSADLSRSHQAVPLISPLIMINTSKLLMTQRNNSGRRLRFKVRRQIRTQQRTIGTDQYLALPILGTF